MVSLSEFLLARIVEDEADARAAQARGSGHWTRDGSSIYDGHPTNEVVDWVYDDAWAHIARWDPARVLAECEAKRRIVERSKWAVEHPDWGNDWEIQGHWDDAMATLRDLALPYADHPDYRPEWHVAEAG